ncbi:MAG TPA: succinylglutamate desuccinylase/aspartoacylase family protein [Alphaproteobacteria bacterium]|nr:succinylglutamate desuccinylase/aspartoacylase family protein [Alphaproteobacteria bacterium]
MDARLRGHDADMMIESFTYKGPREGSRLLILGAVHGNEKCGSIAIKRLMEEIGRGEVKIEAGQLTVAPVCNPRAFEQDVRFTERNLNRYLLPDANPQTYEAQLGNELCALIEQCDVLLDIHSYTVGGAPFAFVGGASEKELAFASRLGAAAVLTGWEQAYAATGRCDGVDKNEGIGTTEYARRCGAIGVTLECGQHLAPEAPEVATRAIHNALAYLGLGAAAAPSAAVPACAVPASKPPVITVTHVFYRDDPGSFPKVWTHLEPVAEGEVLARHANGEAIAAPADGFMIMPRANCPVGEEWFYFGVAEKSRS